MEDMAAQKLIERGREQAAICELPASLSMQPFARDIEWHRRRRQDSTRLSELRDVYFHSTLCDDYLNPMDPPHQLIMPSCPYKSLFDRSNSVTVAVTASLSETAMKSADGVLKSKSLRLAELTIRVMRRHQERRHASFLIFNDGH